MQLAKALQGPTGAPDLQYPWMAMQAAADLVLRIDAAGIVRDAAVPGAELAREMPDPAGWRGQPWLRVISPDSQPAAAALLGNASRAGPAAWRNVTHRPAEEVEVPVLCTALRLAEGDVLVLGRDLLALEISRLALAEDASAVPAYVVARQARGTGAEALCLDLLAPAARRLGELWVEDRCDIIAVTEGVWRLQQALRALGPSAPAEPARLAGGREPPHRVLLAPARGEQHCFGVEMAATFFRRAGWDVLGGAAMLPADPVLLLEQRSFDVVGLSLSAEDGLPALGATIQAIRARSRNPSVAVLVGGRVFVEDPGLALAVGADAAAVDARQAVLQARALLRAGARPARRARP